LIKPAHLMEDDEIFFGVELKCNERR
jgi:hypothetical protein